MATVNWTIYNMNKPDDEWRGKVYTPSQFATQKSPYANQKYSENYAYDVSGARNNLNTHNANKPGAFQSQFQPKINELMDKLSNRKSFSYDVGNDAYYNQLKDKAMATGKLNMQNAMGQAAANTGGFGNSYAQTVGQQVYNQSITDLQSRIPELMQLAYNNYQNEGADMYNRLNMYQTQDSTDYGRHRDNVSDWQTEQGRLTDLLLKMQELDRSAFDSDRSFNQSAWEFGENQRYNAWNDAESRRQEQINADNANSLAKWNQQWNNYWSGEGQNATNKANALDMLYKLALMEQDGYYVTGF